MYFHTGLAEYILFESLHTGNVGSESVLPFSLITIIIIIIWVEGVGGGGFLYCDHGKIGSRWVTSSEPFPELVQRLGSSVLLFCVDPCSSGLVVPCFADHAVCVV